MEILSAIQIMCNGKEVLPFLVNKDTLGGYVQCVIGDIFKAK